MGGSPRMSKDSNLGIMLSRVQYGAPSLQLGIHGPPRRLHGTSKEAAWGRWKMRKPHGLPRNSRKIPGKFSRHHW